MKIHHECANCCRGFDTSLILHEILIEAPSSLIKDKEGGGFDAKIIKVNKILSSIFKLDYVNNIPVPTTFSTGTDHHHHDHPTEKNELFDPKLEMAVCDECGKLLKILHKALEDLNARREERSLLAQRIEKLDQIIMEQVQQKNWIQMDTTTTTTKSPPHHGDLKENDFSKNVGTQVSNSQKDLKSDKKLSKMMNCSVVLSPVKKFEKKSSSNLLSQGTPAERSTRDESDDDDDDVQIIDDDEEPVVFFKNNSSKRKSNKKCKSDDDVEPSVPFRKKLKKEDPASPLANHNHQCPVCPKSFVTSSNLVDHLHKDHVEENSSRCPICTKKLASVYYMRVHLSRHVGHNPFICQFPGCGASFPAPVSLDSHVRKGHDKLESVEETGEGGTNNLNCPICLESFGNSVRLIHHLFRDHTKKDPCQCPICFRTMGRRAPLIGHIRTHFKATSDKKTTTLTQEKKTKEKIMRKKSKKTLTCHICPRTYRYRGPFELHLKTHDTPHDNNCGDQQRPETRHTHQVNGDDDDEDEGEESGRESDLEILTVELDQASDDIDTSIIKSIKEATTLVKPNVIAWSVNN